MSEGEITWAISYLVDNKFMGLRIKRCQRLPMDSQRQLGPQAGVPRAHAFKRLMLTRTTYCISYA